MTITLVLARTAEDFAPGSLRSRAAKAPLQSTTRLFRATTDGADVALVVLDVHEGADCVILYELYLSSAQRNRGIGTRVLAAVEQYAMTTGHGCVEVWPRTLDRRNRSDAQLVKWYRSHGYVSAHSGSERLRKTLSIG